MPTHLTLEQEVAAAIATMCVILFFIAFIILYFNKCNAVESACSSLKLKIINATTRRSFRQLDTVYYTDDTQVGVNVE
ncbi:M016L [Myxoma virus]|uniref:M016L n=1 Tax=Myxoma virus TaxID=10273 RepID=A0A481NAT2_9POXV|nr:M016L [Myxoma virus]QAV36019.1 M016L [Myxoma virus]QAV36526.1 M016L [Myxoma virus]QAV37709.1 M016L [Myxoma virus]